jgi:hypothetical protein
MSAGASFRVVSGADDESVWERRMPLVRAAWPEYNLHGDVLNARWGDLDERYPQYQFVLVDDVGELAGLGNAAPLAWDGTVEGLPSGLDEALIRSLDDPAPPTAACAMQGVIEPGRQGRGLAEEPLKAMAAIARAAGLTDLIAPVRPNWKERYPLAPVERYMRWTRQDGQPFDPWIRVHVRMGAELLAAAPESVRITGTVAEWESWTEMAFPESGEYVFPHGLAPVRIDRERDRGEYWEPNVWLRHRL